MNPIRLEKPLSLPPSRPVEMRIGPYRPCYEIGSGGMASVYIARELGASGLQRTVALKVMHEHLARQEAFKKRFLDEARVLTHIAHPYVCRVVGFGEEQGRPFMAMEYLVGEPISRLLRAMKRRADLPVAERARLFVRVVADLAEGIHAAHETRDPQGKLMGVVHRDVTPQNLFLLYDGTVRVLDFGIARFRNRHVHTATTGRLLGKLPYMAPEQVLSEPYDRRVDVWALGVVLWELITLGRLFKRETEMRTMRAVCSDRIPLVSEVVDGLPPGLDQILARALERNPILRFETALDLARALELWLARTGDPVTHADLAEFLNGFFPGSESERRRWAEDSTPASGVRVLGEAEEDSDDATASFPRSRPADSAPVESAPRSSATAVVHTTPPEARRFSVAAEGPEVTGAVVVTQKASPTERVKRSLPTLVAPVAVTASLVGLLILATLPTGSARIVQPHFDGLAQTELRFTLAPLVLDAPLPPEPVDVESLPLDVEPIEPVLPAAPMRAPLSANLPEPVEASDAPDALGTGDILIVSLTPGVRVFHGGQLLGATPVKARLPAGPVELRMQVGQDSPMVPTMANVLPGRLNLLTVELGR